MREPVSSPLTSLRLKTDTQQLNYLAHSIDTGVTFVEPTDGFEPSSLISSGVPFFAGIFF